VVFSVRKVKERKKAYELADPLPEGQVMKDLSGNMWKLGKAFATGGFGLIYEGINTDQTTRRCITATSKNTYPSDGTTADCFMEKFIQSDFG